MTEPKNLITPLLNYEISKNEKIWETNNGLEETKAKFAGTG